MTLVHLHSSILSAYQPRRLGGGTGGPRSTLLAAYLMGDGGRLEVDAAASLLRVQRVATRESIDLRVTDAWRGRDRQDAARARWLRGAGPFALPWGLSWHGVGLAVDLDVQALGTGYRRLGELMRVEGWEQVRADLLPGDSEAWHWQRVPEGADVERLHLSLWSGPARVSSRGAE